MLNLFWFLFSYIFKLCRFWCLFPMNSAFFLMWTLARILIYFKRFIGNGSHPREDANSALSEDKSRNFHRRTQENLTAETRISIQEHGESKTAEQQILPNKIRILPKKPWENQLQSNQEHNSRLLQQRNSVAFILYSKKTRVLRENQIFLDPDLRINRPQRSDCDEVTLKGGLTAQPLPSPNAKPITLRAVAESNSLSPYKTISELPPAMKLHVNYITENLEDDSVSRHNFDNTLSRQPFAPTDETVQSIETDRSNNESSTGAFLSNNKSGFSNATLIEDFKIESTDSIKQDEKVDKPSQVQLSRRNDYSVLGGQDSHPFKGTDLNNMAKLPMKVSKLESERNPAKGHQQLEDNIHYSAYPTDPKTVRSRHSSYFSEVNVLPSDRITIKSAEEENQQDNSHYNDSESKTVKPIIKSKSNDMVDNNRGTTENILHDYKEKSEVAKSPSPKSVESKGANENSLFVYQGELEADAHAVNDTIIHLAATHENKTNLKVENLLSEIDVTYEARKDSAFNIGVLESKGYLPENKAVAEKEHEILKNTHNSSGNTGYYKVDKSGEKNQQHTRTVPKAVINKVKVKNDQPKGTDCVGLAKTLQTSTKNETNLKTICKGGRFPENESVSEGDQKNLKYSRSLPDNTVSTRDDRSTEGNQAYTGTIPKTVENKNKIKNDQHERKQRSEAEENANYENVDLAKIFQTIGETPNHGNKPASEREYRPNLTDSHGIHYGETGCIAMPHSLDTNQAYVGTTPKDIGDRGKIKNDQHDSNLKYDAEEYSDGAKTSQTRRHIKACPKIFMNEKVLPGDDLFSRKREPQDLIGQHETSTESNQSTEVVRLYSGTAPKSVAIRGSIGNDEHETKPKSEVEKFLDYINLKNSTRVVESSETRKENEINLGTSRSKGNESQQNLRHCHSLSSVTACNKLHKSKEHSESFTSTEAVKGNDETRNYQYENMEKSATGGEPIRLAQTFQTRGETEINRTNLPESEQVPAEKWRNLTEISSLNDAKASTDTYQSTEGIDNHIDTVHELLEYQSSIRKGKRHQTKRKKNARVKEDFPGNNLNTNKEHQRTQNNFDNHLSSGCEKIDVFKSCLEMPQCSENYNRSAAMEKLEDRLSTDNTGYDNLPSHHNKNEVTTGNLHTPPTGRRFVDLLGYELVVANSYNAGYNQNMPTNSSESISNFSRSMEAQKSLPREENCFDLSRLIDKSTGIAISPALYERVILKLNEIGEKAEVFAELVDTFKELKGSNQHYYIEESLRRLIYRLDDMFDDIGEVVALREARKQVYKYIFWLFDRLDEKTLENKQGIRNEQMQSL